LWVRAVFLLTGIPLHSMNNTPKNPKSPFRAPSPRTTAVLAAAMLAIGFAVGAAIGPAPTPSFALNRLLPLLPSFPSAHAKSSTSAVQPPAVSPEATPSSETGAGARRRRRKREAEAAATPSAEATAPAETTPAATTPTSKAKKKAAALAPVTKVWLIELGNSSFGEAAAQPSAAPYIEGQAIPAGTLLSGSSALDASAFANDATLIAGTPPQLLDTIVQPPCPEGAAGAPCAPDTPGALTTADEFLKATLPTITSSPAYRENGLVVITFASIANATATGLPAGAATATLTSTPPAGALLISPFVTAGAKSSATLSPASPKQSLEKLLRR
jgi:hypothetical protein